VWLIICRSLIMWSFGLWHRIIWQLDNKILEENNASILTFSLKMEAICSPSRFWYPPARLNRILTQATTIWRLEWFCNPTAVEFSLQLFAPYVRITYTYCSPDLCSECWSHIFILFEVWQYSTEYFTRNHILRFYRFYWFILIYLICTCLLRCDAM
jgi:hypothetical protein